MHLSAGGAAQPLKLRLALPTVPHAGLLHLAAALGYFHDQGIDASLMREIHGKAALAELLQGRADLAVVADVPVVIELLKGVPLNIVASVANAPTELAVLGRTDRGIHGPRDLIGKRIGVSLGTSGEYFLWAFLVRNRMAPDAPQFVDLPPAKLIGALRDGDVDAIAAWQPVRHQAELDFGNAIVSLPAPDAYAQRFVLVGRREYVQAHAQDLSRLIRALLDAEVYVRAAPARAKSMLAGLFKLNPEILDPSWRDMTLEVEQQQAQLVTLEDVAAWAMARGYAPRQPMPNFLSYLDLDPLLAVNPERVTVVR